MATSKTCESLSSCVCLTVCLFTLKNHTIHSRYMTFLCGEGRGGDSVDLRGETRTSTPTLVCAPMTPVWDDVQSSAVSILPLRVHLPIQHGIRTNDHATARPGPHLFLSTCHGAVLSCLCTCSDPIQSGATAETHQRQQQVTQYDYR